MISKFLLILGVSICFLQGQELLEKEKPLKGRVLHTKTQGRGNQRMTLTKINPPRSAEIRARIAARVKKPDRIPSATSQASKLPAQTYVLSSEKSEGGYFIIKWRSMGSNREHIAFSNVDWNLMSSMQNLQGVSHKFSFMLFPLSITGIEKNGESANAVQGSLPAFEQEGARFIFEGSEMPGAIPQEFMATVHTYFDENHQSLLVDSRLRAEKMKSASRKGWAKLESRRDVEIRYWVRQEGPKSKK